MMFSKTTVLAVAASVAAVLLTTIATNVVGAAPSCSADGCDLKDEPFSAFGDKCDTNEGATDCAATVKSPPFTPLCGTTNEVFCVGYKTADPLTTYPDICPDAGCICPDKLYMVCYKCSNELDCIVDDVVLDNGTPVIQLGKSMISAQLRRQIVQAITPDDNDLFCNDKDKTIQEQPGCDSVDCTTVGFSSTVGCCIQDSITPPGQEPGCTTGDCPAVNKCPVFGNECTGNGQAKGLSNVAAYVIDFNCDPGVYDDPHFDTFGGDHYDFQGACDLVLVDNAGYKNGKGLYIHARTKIFGSWSSLVSGAVKIGDDILEVHGEDLALINGVEFPVPQVEGTEQPFPVKIGGFDLTVQVFGPHSRRHIIHMGNGEQIWINNFKEFVNVYLHKPRTADFEGSVGMWGTYSEHGSMLARDRKTVVEDGDAFGFEWQVRPDSDPQLFHVIDGPQYPAKCTMPEKATAEQRHLRAMGKKFSEDDAKQACAIASPSRMESCVADVFGSDNLEMAQLYAHTHIVINKM